MLFASPHKKTDIAELFKAFDNKAISQTSTRDLLPFYGSSAIMRHHGAIATNLSPPRYSRSLSVKTSCSIIRAYSKPRSKMAL